MKIVDRTLNEESSKDFREDDQQYQFICRVFQKAADYNQVHVQLFAADGELLRNFYPNTEPCKVFLARGGK